MAFRRLTKSGFNTQQPEGGWVHFGGQNNTMLIVSTHSSPKAAGTEASIVIGTLAVSTHSSPKAAGFKLNGV